ncbi:Bacterial extracellular solute-binding protein, family 5 Middle [Enhygromyxa salina]|uniref:Bacterial extracellular solute-binding protein, family 5 Middle n=1 Tax=Enhygromyxa salina TaxID=215803 RepID=A0A2S9XCP9_9BACT|nr:ABC transporter substrate-binding protein [Enhygromyxa salina]PRP90634.1 Bacterial extracellular solute-binding protein, family 5 Middle [Enhygromyxa salina]
MAEQVGMSTRRRERVRRRRAEARAVAQAVLSGLVLLGTLAGLAWLGAERDSASASSTSAATEPEPAPASATELAALEPVVIALPQLPRKFDPLDDMEPWAERISEDLIFEGLVRRTRDRYPWVEPAIADRCEVDQDHAVMIVSCHIPEGIRFHDGSELSMDDVVYSLRYWLMDRRSWARQRHGLSTFRRVEIVDGPPGQRDPGRWVKLRFGQREPLALEALSAIKIVPMAAHRGRASRFAQAPIGTGPMRLTTLEADRVVLERFDDYRDEARRAGAPSLAFRAINDGAAALTALRRGEVHLLPELAPNHVPVELGKPGMSARLRAWVVSPASYDVLLWNLGRGLPANPGLRAALHDAVPFATITRTIYGAPGLPAAAPVDLHDPTPIDLYALAGIRAGQPTPAGLPTFPPLDRDQEGAERAAAALDALGWPAKARGMRRRASGPLRVPLAWDGHPGRASSVRASIRATWESIGVRSPDTATSWRFMLAVLMRGDFRVAMLHFGGHSDEDLFHMFHSRGALNLAGVADEQLDAALDGYRAAATRGDRDRAKRRVAARLAELRVVSILHAPAHVTLSSRRLKTVEFIDDLPRLDTLALGDEPVDWRARAREAAGEEFCWTCR